MLLLKKPHAKPLGESRTQAARRFFSLERSLCSNGKFKEFANVIEEYFELDHAEIVPVVHLEKPPQEVFTCQCTLSIMSRAPQPSYVLFSMLLLNQQLVYH